ncbi:hypothetical protein NHX12_001030 [Muraenolepis orangiensis]|uniref:Uncharacterized protein n=1 Tax=Muraenolepis orangiensis TaxID=630683 RepID=A0A9Q0IEK1_9TELE|nr:hypothetical protein NHX12_001030 [Muraenolepis orangiensis]
MAHDAQRHAPCRTTRCESDSHTVCENHALYRPERCKAFRCDLTQDDLRHHVPQASVDVVTLIFVLSAIHPDKMARALENIFRVRTGKGSAAFI